MIAGYKGFGMPLPFPIAKAATKHDTNPLPDGVASALYVTATGNIAFKDAAGNSVTLTSVPAFTLVPIAASQVLNTGTTATVLVLYHQI